MVFSVDISQERAERRRLKWNILFSFNCPNVSAKTLTLSVMASFVFNAKETLSIIDEKSGAYDKEKRFN